MNDLQTLDYDRKVREVERVLLELPQVDLGTTMFAHGRMGCRTIVVPKGTALTGAQTNLANILIVSGDITVSTPDGPKRFTGYHILKAKPGFKRAGYAHEDTICTTIWHTDKTDAVEMENEMTDEACMLQTRRPGIVFQKTELVEG